jgi:AcrR family transcriptional regulator
MVPPPLPPPEHTDAPSTDGRHLRRDRNREAVVQALLGLYNDGILNPSTEEIAERSGVSARSLFRYFDDVDDLCQAAIIQQQQNVRPLLPIGATPDQPTEQKVQALVRQRAELFEAVESVALVSRLRAPFQLVVADRLTLGREFLRNQIAVLFAPELAAMPHTVAAGRLATADIAASFESWRLLRDDQHLPRAKAAAATADALFALFTAPASPAHAHDGDLR